MEAIKHALRRHNTTRAQKRRRALREGLDRQEFRARTLLKRIHRGQSCPLEGLSRKDLGPTIQERRHDMAGARNKQRQDLERWAQACT